MIGSLMMCVSVVILLAGMIAGITMGIQQNFVLAPGKAYIAAPIIGSLVVVLAMVLFVVVIFRTRSA